MTATDPELTALGLFGMTNWAYQWFTPGGKRTSAEIAEHLWGQLMQGLAVKAVPRRGARAPRRSA